MATKKRAKKARARRRPTVERKIYFYRANIGIGPDRRPLPFDPVPALQQVNNLSFANDDRYLFDNGSDATWCMVDSARHPCRARVAISRRSNLPLREQRGQLSALNLRTNEGLAEQVHVIFFSNNIVGSDFNFYGPRMGRFANYLKAKTTWCDSLAFEPLMRSDVHQKLNDLQDVRVLDLKVRASYIDTIAAADRSLGAAFEAAREAGGAELIELVLRPPSHSRLPLSNRLLQAVRRLGGNSDVKTEANKFRVKGMSSSLGRSIEVDVLSDQLISKKQIIKENEKSRALDSDSAYEAIREAYNELARELNAAASLVVGEEVEDEG